MEHNTEEVSIHRRRAGPQRDGPQPDKADSSESRRGGSKRSFELIPENEKEKHKFQAQFRGTAEETFTSRSHRGRNIIRSHYDEPYPKRLGPIPPPLDLEKIRRVKLSTSQAPRPEQRVESKTPQAPGPEVGDILVANYDFTARSYDELTLTKGVEVVLIEKDDKFGDGWFSGEIPLTGKSGIFPANYTSIKARRVLPTILTDPWARSPDTTSDEPASIPTVPRLPSRSPTEIPSSPISSSSYYGVDHEDDDISDDRAVVIEEHIPPASVLVESDSVAGHTVSNTSYSEMFSEESRKQLTDPSSWLNSSSANQAGVRDRQVYTAFSGTIKELVVAREMEDCSRSISSVADSIGSANSDGGFLGQAGVNYVVAKFTQSDPELLALYTEASQRLTKDRFVDNNRRLLKKLYLDFAHEQQTPSQREAVAFFRSRRRRAEISLDIFRTVIPDNDDNYLDDRRDFSMLNAYFETLDASGETESP